MFYRLTLSGIFLDFVGRYFHQWDQLTFSAEIYSFISMDKREIVAIRLGIISIVVLWFVLWRLALGENALPTKQF